MPSDLLSLRRGRGGRSDNRPAAELPGAVTLTAGQDQVVQVDHGHGARSRLQPDALCLLRTTKDGSGPVLVELATGCGWFEAAEDVTFEIRRPGARVRAEGATVAVTGEPDGSTAVVVLAGTVVVDPDGADSLELHRQAALVLADGKIREVIELTPADLASDRWIVANRLLDTEQQPQDDAPEPEPQPAPAPAPAPEAGVEPEVEASPTERRSRRPLLVVGVLAVAAALGIGIAQVGGDDGDAPTAAPERPAVSTTAAPTTSRPAPTTAAPTTTARPAPSYEAELTTCRRAGGAVEASGTVANLSRADRTYRLTVEFTGSSGTVVEATRVDVAVPAGETRPWSASSTASGIASCDHNTTNVL